MNMIIIDSNGEQKTCFLRFSIECKGRSCIHVALILIPAKYIITTGITQGLEEQRAARLESRQPHR